MTINAYLTDLVWSCIVLRDNEDMLWEVATEKQYALVRSSTPLFIAVQILDNHDTYPNSGVWIMALSFVVTSHLFREDGVFGSVATVVLVVEMWRWRSHWIRPQTPQRQLADVQHPRTSW